MKQTFRFLSIMLCAILMTTAFTACSDDDDEDSTSIVGTWEYQDHDEEDGTTYVTQVKFNTDRTFVQTVWETSDPTDKEIMEGDYEVDGNKLFLYDEYGSTESYTFSISGNRLTVKDADTSEQIVLYRK